MGEAARREHETEECVGVACRTFRQQLMFLKKDDAGDAGLKRESEIGQP
jgi:hypothetical protein